MMALMALLVWSGPAVWTPASAASVKKEEKKEVLGPEKAGLSTQDVKALSDLLKDDTKRKEFLDHLDTLLKVKKDQDEALAQPLSETIGFRGYTESLFKDYQKFLKKYDLSSSLLGRIGLSAFILVVAFGAFFIVHKICKNLQQALGRFRRRFGIEGQRFGFYVRVIRFSGYLLVFFLALYALAWNWDAKILDFVKSKSTFEVLSGLLNALMICGIAVVLWEMFNGLIEVAIRRAEGKGETRIRTLLPLLRHVLAIVFGGLFMLILLSEFGINIMPLLAGAGILGIAVGFGAQTMIKDFLTGFTIILEDLIQVGDVVRLAGHSGVVERISIRKVQLRDQSGIVYTVPFSEIATVENLTKDFSYYVMNVNIAYDEDPDRVMDILRAVDTDLRADAAFGEFMLEPIEIMGVDQFGESAVVILARIKTSPLKQWPVGREFNRRMKIAFVREKVEIPFPHRMVYVRGGLQTPAPEQPSPEAFAAAAGA